MDKSVRTVAQYLEAIKNEVETANTDHSVVLFRGEAKIYDTPCQPNIFRKNFFQRDRFFEKNLFDEMTANHLTNGNTYLEKAIDAQHGGFPSRLLDVSYNCLAALYFAVTPYYTQSENAYDGQDGMVYIFFLENMYCPAGEHINDAYDACIKHDKKWFDGQELFQKNHKLIDHIKKNPRIIAQQGAFILFQGDCLSSFPAYRYRKIRIDGHFKEKLREELRLYFGIHTGSIYPEEFNLVDEMIRKSQQISTQPFQEDNEIELIFYNMRQLICYYVDKLELDAPEEYRYTVHQVEEELMDYRKKIDCFLKNMCNQIDADHYRIKYNKIIEDFAEEAERIMSYEIDFAIEICKNALKI